jgi:predicted  nucleic acid-binding Zn-ribbon protein
VCDPQALSSRVEWVSAEKEKLESELQDLLSQKEELDTRVDDLQRRLSDSQLQQTSLFSEYYSETWIIPTKLPQGTGKKFELSKNLN